MKRYAVVFLAIVALASCRSNPFQPVDPALGKGFTCCNLHYQGDWISDQNWTGFPFLPAGLPASVVSYGRNMANIEIDGRAMRLGHDYGRAQEPLERFVAKGIVKDDPRARLAGFPPAVREAIRQGKVSVGMTKEQVIMSLGHPQTDNTAHLEQRIWYYWVNSFLAYQVVWGADERVEAIAGNPTARERVTYRN